MDSLESLVSTLLIITVCIFFGLLFVFAFINLKMMKDKAEKEVEKDRKEKKQSKVEQMYNVQSIFDFMEFDKIEDNMIIQKKGTRYLMIVKCQGINYDLMSGVEKTSVEQGFLQFLNTLRDPIQIYVETRTVDLTGSIDTYKEKIKILGSNLVQKDFEYNQKLRSGRYSNKDLEKEYFELTKIRNLYEYGMDIVGNTEKMSLNRNILSKQYYVILEYMPEEAFNDDYAKDEVKNIAFSELYTRAQSTISLLTVCGVMGKILDSVELADLLYTAYNRDEAEVYDLKKAINSGYDNVYTTAPDVLTKRMKELDKKLEIEALEKANEAIYKVKEESEKEKKLKQKEKNYETMVRDLAREILNNNKDILGEEIVEKAKGKIKDSNTKTKGEISKK